MSDHEQALGIDTGLPGEVVQSVGGGVDKSVEAEIGDVLDVVVTEGGFATAELVVTQA